MQIPASAAIAAVEQTVRQVAPVADAQVAPGTGAVNSVDVLAALAELRVVQGRLAAWEPLLIGAARHRGVSWAAIAPALGVASRQAAERRYLRLNPHATDQESMTGEQRVQAARDRRAGDRAVTQWARDNAARLRRLAAQITALDDLDPATQQSIDRVLHALGDSRHRNPAGAAGRGRGTLRGQPPNTGRPGRRHQCHHRPTTQRTDQHGRVVTGQRWDMRAEDVLRWFSRLNNLPGHHTSPTRR
jgi:hypothetical protein